MELYTDQILQDIGSSFDLLHWTLLIEAAEEIEKVGYCSFLNLEKRVNTNRPRFYRTVSFLEGAQTITIGNNIRDQRIKEVRLTDNGLRLIAMYQAQNQKEGNK